MQGQRGSLKWHSPTMSPLFWWFFPPPSDSLNPTALSPPTVSHPQKHQCPHPCANDALLWNGRIKGTFPAHLMFSCSSVLILCGKTMSQVRLKQNMVRYPRSLVCLLLSNSWSLIWSSIYPRPTLAPALFQRETFLGSESRFFFQW